MRHLEDLAVGDRTRTASEVVTEADIIAFAKRFDPQPMHVDPATAVNGPLGRLAASGWHTAAIVMRLMVDAKLLGGAPLLGLGVDEIRWPNPVIPGDTITAEIEIMSITPSRSMPSHGIVRIRVTAKNQNGDVVLIMFPKLWVPKA
jgi:acyl dehydratase